METQGGNNLLILLCALFSPQCSWASVTNTSSKGAEPASQALGPHNGTGDGSMLIAVMSTVVVERRCPPQSWESEYLVLQ